MAYVDMYSELNGSVPKIPIDLCRTLINRAWKDIRRQNLWSFNLFEANWISPPILNTGTANVTRGSSSVTLNSTASAALIAANNLPTPIIQRQFRQAISTIYNIWSVDSSVPSAVVLTLDRNYAEATATSATYSIYQAYYPTPMEDFLTFLSVRDMTNFIDLFLHRYNREGLDAQDPQRTWYYFPTDVVYYQLDLNPASPHYKWHMFELWGAPQYSLVYQLYGLRKGVDLSADTDTLPGQIGEDCVLAKAKQYAYEWAEANKGDMPRNQGADYKFLMGETNAEYKRLYKEYRKQDRETVNNWFTIRRNSLYGKVFSYYSSVSGTAYPGISF